MERVITLKANFLAESYGLNVEIVTYSDRIDTYFKLSEKVKLTNLSKVGSNQKNTFNNVVSYINASNPDVLISTGGKDISLARRINKDIYKILELHFCFRTPVLREKSLKRNWFFYILGYLKIARSVYLAKSFNLIVALSQRDARLWSRYSSTKVISIVNPSTFEVDFSRVKLVKSKVTQFIAVGRLSMEKDFESLLNSCSILKHDLKHDNWLLDIYGEGELYEALNHQLINLGLDKHVTINKPVSNIEAIYLKADFLLMTSMYEGLPMVLIEAMSFGIPCVSFDCESGPAEIINDDHNGYLVRDRDINRFALTMKNCSELDVKKYEYLSENAFKTGNNYSQKKVLGHWNDLIKGLQS